MYLVNTLQEFGDMQQRKQNFAFALTILMSNTFSNTDANHLLKNLLKITESPCTLKLRTTVGLPLTGIMKINISTFPCQFTSPNISNVFYTLSQNIHAIHPTNGQCQHMSKSISMKNYRTAPHLLIKNSPKTYKPRSANYCNTHEQLIQACYLL